MAELRPEQPVQQRLGGACRRGQLPRATNLVSGPSRTGDIEQTIVLGAHGPYRVHVVIVGAAPPAGSAA